MIKNSTTRFSGRVENYVKYRPSYPAAIIPFLQKACGLMTESLVADIGSGTGKLTELFLKNGNRVFGVEPNREMREAGERLLSDYPKFQSVHATAEATTLADHSIELIVAGQAFHWFDREAARREFFRILKPGGCVALIWNDRKINASPFLMDYEKLLVTYATEYREVNHRNVDLSMLGSFFGPDGFKHAEFPNAQVFDWAGLQGRLLSSSYAPEAGHPNHAPMLQALDKLFERYQSDGKVVLACDTMVYYGQFSE
ncbi:MAG TPA: class I SAM-dependent methyltransferase [Verrucomicrobiae bacterium]|nr:class I SAM-dependent methyltransferase [Verrucomicrobiae bacterium]